jgi:hypothetical protein
MAITTSGTVSTTPFNVERVIDHAMRRAGRAPQDTSAEDLRIAQECLFTLTSEWTNAGFPLWTRQFLLLSAGIGSPDVYTPTGTMEVLHVYWRALNPWRGGATLTTGGDGSTLFGGQPNADVVVAGPNPGVAVLFGTPTELDEVGVLLGGASSLTTAMQMQTSPDGLNWTTVQTLPSTTFTPGVWSYFALNPSITASYTRIIAVQSGSLALNQINFGLANAYDTELGVDNIDDHYNLPNRFMQGDRPTSAFVDRQVASQDVKIWPVMNTTAFYSGLVVVLARRYIQDPGSLTNNMEVPQRALEALMWRLASTLIFELPDTDKDSQTSYFGQMAKQARITAIEQKATKAEQLWWSEERTRGPIRLTPNLRCYTR